jgi:hypothetical protein
MSATPASNTWGALLAEAFAKAPDPDERLPISNRPETVYGSTIPFLVGATTQRSRNLYAD